MINMWLRFVGGTVIVLALLPSIATAQPVARSFEELGTIVKVGETVLLTDQTGRETAAKIADVSASSLLVLAKEKTRDARGMERDTWTAKRTFSERDVRRIRRSGGHAVRTGALIGAGVALVPTVWFAAAYGENEGGGFCSVCLLAGLLGPVPLGAGIGAGVGLGIRQARRRTIYVEPGQPSSVGSPPLLPKGVFVSLRF